MEIYLAKPEDAIFISEINVKTWLSTYKSIEYWIDSDILKKYPTNKNEKDKFIKRKAKEISDCPWSYFLAKDNGNVIWYASGKIHDDKPYNEFFAIYILPEYQWKWIWKILADEVFKYLWNKKDTLVEVILYNKNAISFYERLWFKFKKNLNDLEIINWIWVPEIQMIKTNCSIKKT